MQEASSAISSSRHSLFMLRSDRLRPGDILLTRSPNALVSEAIRSITSIRLLAGRGLEGREEFSHAAICVAHGTFVEALGSAGVCRLAIRQTAAKDRNNIRVLRLKSGVQNAGRIAEQAGKLAEEFMYRRYADWRRFGGMLVGAMQDSVRERLFCSQLVTAAYEEAGLRLFDDVAPEQVTPGRLTRCELLDDVTDECVTHLSTDDEPEFYLDGAERGEREHTQESRDFQAVLSSRAVRKALHRLGIARPPATLLMLQRILIDTRDASLNDAIRKGLHERGYREVESKKQVEDARCLLSATEENLAGIRKECPSMSDDVLWFWLTDARNTVVMLNEDLATRWEQVRGYRTILERTRLSTFGLLLALWERRALFNETTKELKVAEFQVLFAEAERRGQIVDGGG